ncbi:MAG TPA: hypothetical protein VF601_02920 [Beijerinckiaceae bacterium]|jgi:hypothetical protein
MKRWGIWVIVGVIAACGAAAVTFVLPGIVDPLADRVGGVAIAPPPVPAEAPRTAAQPARPDSDLKAVFSPDAHPAATGSLPAPTGPDPRDGARAASIARAAPVAPAGPYRFSARRESGALVLSGFVPDVATRDALLRSAREQFFHERIVDETRIGEGAPRKFADGARFALDQLAQLASGEASVVGTSLKVEGDVLYAQAAEDIRAKTRKNAPAGFTGSAEIRTRDEGESGGE